MMRRTLPIKSTVAAAMMIVFVAGCQSTSNDAPDVTGSSVEPAAADTGESALPPDPNEIICKRETQAGSATGGERTCRTRAQWDAIADGSN